MTAVRSCDIRDFESTLNFFPLPSLAPLLTKKERSEKKGKLRFFFNFSLDEYLWDKFFELMNKPVCVF